MTDNQTTGKLSKYSMVMAALDRQKDEELDAALTKSCGMTMKEWATRMSHPGHPYDAALEDARGHAQAALQAGFDGAAQFAAAVVAIQDAIKTSDT